MWRKEPARILAVISAGLALAIGFGLSLSGQQINLIMVFSAAVLALLTGEVTRSQVVSPQTADNQIKTALNMPPTTKVQEVIEATEKSKGVE